MRPGSRCGFGRNQVLCVAEVTSSVATAVALATTFAPLEPLLPGISS